MKKRYILMLSAAVLAVGTLLSCDKDNPGKQEASGKLEGFDDLVFFRSAIAWEDDLGVTHRNYGEVLYNDEPRHLYVGADSFEEAREIFLNWVAPKGDVKETDGRMEYHLTDENGKSQGSVTLAHSGDSGHVAEVTASAGVDLGAFDRITFLQKSSWPAWNGEDSPYQLGDILTVTVHELGFFKGVCIREKAPGVSGLAVAISPKEYNGGTDLDDGSEGMMTTSFLSKQNKAWVNNGCPNKDEAVIIAKILSNDWDLFEACFDEAGGGPLRKGWNYWTEQWDYKAVYDRRWAMVLSTPNNDGLEWFDITYNKTFKRVIFKMNF